MAANSLIAGQVNSPRFTERNIPPALAQILCERNAVAEDFVKNGVFDAQIEVTVMKPKESLPKEASEGARKKLLAMAQKRSRAMAEKSEQLGYAFGVCEDGAAWAVTFPAPYPITVEDGELTIPEKARKEICSHGSIKVLYVPEKKGRGVSIPISRNLTAKLPSQSGYIGVMCTPNAFLNSGPREWAIIPIAGVTSQNLVSAAPPDATLEIQLISWINEKRKLELLGPLVSDSELSAAAKRLLLGRNIQHNIHALTVAHMALAHVDRGLFGENRVAGRTVSELIDLLWMSPAHRDLILHPVADAVGITVSKTPEGLFAVIVVGRKVTGPVAKLIEP